jgi:uncharacterized repeat protein (TIGR01451 family)
MRGSRRTGTQIVSRLAATARRRRGLGLTAVSLVIGLAFVTISRGDPIPNDPSTSDAASGFESAADLSLSLEQSGNEPRVGDEVAYTISVTNQGPDAASSLELTIAVEGPVRFISVGGELPPPPLVTSCLLPVAPPSPVLCELDRLPVNGTWTRTVVVSVRSRGRIKVSADIAATSPDPASDNNHATITTTIPRRTLVAAARKVLVHPKPARPGQPLRVQLRFTTAQPGVPVRLVCRARIGGTPLRLAGMRIRRTTGQHAVASCQWRVPKRVRGSRRAVRGSVALRSATSTLVRLFVVTIASHH